MKAYRVRRAEFAGRLYPDDNEALLRYIEQLLLDFAPDRAVSRVRAAFLPHGAFPFSAECAARALAEIHIPDRVLILHPIHEERELNAAVGDWNAWQTPLAVTNVDRDFSQALSEHLGVPLSRDMDDDEPSVEAVLPLLQVLNHDLQIATLALGVLDLQTIRSIAARLSEFLHRPEFDETLLIISTDLHHHGEREVTRRLDASVLDACEFLRFEELVNTVATQGVDMCGVAAMALGMETCRRLGCQTFHVVDECDTSDTSGDYDDVTGFASGYIF